MKVLVILVVTFSMVHPSIITTRSPPKILSDEDLRRQKLVLDLLDGVGSGLSFTSEWDNYNISANADSYNGSKVVTEFLYFYKKGFLPKDDTFSLRWGVSMYQTIKIFDLLYFAKDFNTFYKTSCWARAHLNSEQFIYAFYVAVYHRQDCQDLTLPSLYEVIPKSFVPNELMKKLYSAQIEGYTKFKVMVNNTGWEDSWHESMYRNILLGTLDSVNTNTEDRLSYFREDAGLNDFVAQFFLLYPTWLSLKKYDELSYFRRGEILYYFAQQLFARYALERYANQMPETEMLFWDKPIKVGYDPKIMTSNGHMLYSRAENMKPSDFNPDEVYRISGFEFRIHGAIDWRMLFNERNDTWVQLDNGDGVNAVGNVLWATPDSASPHYYGSYFYRSLDALGNMLKTEADRNMVSGAISFTTTAARDPAFYMFLQRLLNIFERHKNYLPIYTEEELGFPGVKVESFNVEPLITFFTRFEFDVTNGLPISSDKTRFNYQLAARQFALSHKPFSYTLTVACEKSEDAIIRVFIGPRYNSNGQNMTIEQSRMAFVELDRFPVTLTSGKNTISRSSKDSLVFLEDNESFKSLYKRVNISLSTKEAFLQTNILRCGLPERLMLPKGSKSGQQFVIFTIVSPIKEKYIPKKGERLFDGSVPCGGAENYDGRPFGFPFDRMVLYDDEFKTPNMYMKDVIIYHK